MDEVMSPILMINKAFVKSGSTEYGKRKEEKGLTNLAQKILGVIVLLTNEENDVLTVSLLEMCRFLGVERNGGKGRACVIKAIAEIASKQCIIRTGKDKYVNVGWVDKFMIEDNDKLTLLINPLMRNIFFNKKDGFTKYNWFYILGMKSKYGARLYEVLYSLQYLKNSKNQISMVLDDLKDYIGVKQLTGYNKPSRLIERAIAPAIKDINEYSDIKVSMIYKTGSDSIIFEINKKVDQIANSMIIDKYNSPGPQKMISIFNELKTYMRAHHINKDEFDGRYIEYDENLLKSISNNEMEQISNSKKGLHKNEYSN